MLSLLALVGVAANAQSESTDSLIKQKTRVHCELRGEARYHSALELAELYLKLEEHSPHLDLFLRVVDYCSEAARLGRRLRRPELEAQALGRLGLYYGHRNRIDSLVRVRHLLDALSRQHPQPRVQYQARLIESLYASKQADTLRMAQACSELVDVAQRLGELDLLYESRWHNVRLFRALGQTNRMIDQLWQLAALAPIDTNYARVGDVYEELSKIYESLGRLDSAQILIQQSFRYHLRVADRVHHGSVLMRIGNYYVASEQLKQAITYFEQSQQIIDSIRQVRQVQKHPHFPQNAIDVAIIRGNIVGCYVSLNQWDSSAYWLHRARYSAQVIGSSLIDSYYFLQLGYIHYRLNRPDSAFRAADSALAVVKQQAIEKLGKVSSQIGLFCAHALRGAVYGRYVGMPAARADLLAAYDLLQLLKQQFPDPNEWMFFHRLQYFDLLHKYLAQLGESQKALDALEYYALLVRNRQADYQVNHRVLFSSIALTARERQIELLNLQNELAWQYQQRQYLYVGAGLLLLGLGVGLIWVWSRRNRERAEQNRRLHTENQKIDFQNDMLGQTSQELSQVLETLKEQSRLLADWQTKHSTSLQTAQAIQSHFLGNRQLFAEAVGPHLLYYEPRDGVSGDLYWWRAEPDCLSVAVVDCTGHGVPGALMSILAYHLLEEWIEQYPGQRPEEGLSFLDQSIWRLLKQHRTQVAQDGMDLALFQIEWQAGRLWYAGARRDLWVRRCGNWIRLTATRCSIGGQHGAAEAFAGRSLELETGDRLFAFTDGVTDQFGGPRRRKLGQEALLAELATYDNLTLEEAAQRFQIFQAHWRGSLVQIDDALLLGVEYHPSRVVYAS